VLGARAFCEHFTCHESLGEEGHCNMGDSKAPREAYGSVTFSLLGIRVEVYEMSVSKGFQMFSFSIGLAPCWNDHGVEISHSGLLK